MIGVSLEKVRRYFRIIKVFKAASFVLQNGKYTIYGNRFTLSNDVKNLSKIKIVVKSKKKNPYLLKDGVFKVTPYKYLFFDDKKAFSFVKGKERYLLIKKNIELTLNKLPFKTMHVDFFADKNLIVSNIVKGNQYDDEEHLWLLLDYYLNSISNNLIEERKMDMAGSLYNIMYYPQHGDCHSKNIFWNDGIPTLIDLDDVDVYPLFYDIFYYVIASMHEGAFIFFRNRFFEEKIKNFCNSIGLVYSDDIVDLYLGAYIYYWVNKMKMEMEFHEIHFYLKWFEVASLSSYPIVSAAMEKYKINLKNFGICE